MSRSRLGILLILAGLLANIMISRPIVSGEGWRRQLAASVPFSPVPFGGNLLLAVGTDTLLLLAEDGAEVGSTTLSSPLRFPPLVCGSKTAVIVDETGTLRGFNASLVEAWHRRLPVRPDLPLHQGTPDQIIIPLGSGILAAYESATGDPLWQCVLPGSIDALGVERLAVCLIGQGSGAARAWNLAAVDLTSGGVRWMSDQTVEERFPLMGIGTVLGCDPKGRPHLWDLETGTVRYQHPGDGVKVAGIRGDNLFFLAAGGSRLDHLQVKHGEGWSSTLPQGSLGLFFGDSELLVADRENIRCWSLSTGAPRWSQDLGKVLSAVPVRDGMMVHHTDRFFGVERFLSLFAPQQARPVWTVAESGVVWPPVSLSRGDILCTRLGLVRLLPR